MDIHHQALLRKIGQELMKAEQAERAEAVKQHLYSIKTLCELALDGSESVQAQTPAFSKAAPIEAGQPVQLSLRQQPAMTVAVNKQEKLETEDGANGESIFDF